MSEEATLRSALLRWCDERADPNDMPARMVRSWHRSLARVVAQEVPQDVIRLVMAARIVAFEDQSREAMKELAAASEAFASRVPWDDEPDATSRTEEQGG